MGTLRVDREPPELPTLANVDRLCLAADIPIQDLVEVVPNPPSRGGWERTSHSEIGGRHCGEENSGQPAPLQGAAARPSEAGRRTLAGVTVLFSEVISLKPMLQPRDNLTLCQSWRPYACVRATGCCVAGC